MPSKKPRIWLVYDRERAARNSWLINHMNELAARRTVALELVLVEEITALATDGVRCGIATAPHTPAPDIAIFRCVRPEIQHLLEDAGVAVYNSARMSEIFNDKMRTLAFANEHGVPTMPTVLLPQILPTMTCQQILAVVARAGITMPFVMKPVDGHGGTAVSLIRTEQELMGYVREISPHHRYLAQACCSAPGKDVRVYVLDGEVVAAIERRATAEEEIRSNFSLGGAAKAVSLTPALQRWVDLLVPHVDPGLVGMDFIFDKGEPVLNEIEDVVGARTLYSVTDTDIFAQYLDMILTRYVR